MARLLAVAAGVTGPIAHAGSPSGVGIVKGLLPYGFASRLEIPIYKGFCGPGGGLTNASALPR